MTTNKWIGVLAVTMCAVWTAPAFAQAPPPSDLPKTAAKPSPGFAGAWDVAMQSPNGAVYASLSIVTDEKDPKKVTGTITSGTGSFPLTGEIAEGVLSFAIRPDGTNEVWMSGKLQEDGSMKGTLDMQGNSIPWTATRAKAK